MRDVAPQVLRADGPPSPSRAGRSLRVFCCAAILALIWFPVIGLLMNALGAACTSPGRPAPGEPAPGELAPVPATPR